MDVRIVHKCSTVILLLLLASTAESLRPRLSRLETRGTPFSERANPATFAIGKKVYLFGGSFEDVLTGENEVLGDMYLFDIVKRKWSPINVTGTHDAPDHTPAARVFSAFVTDDRRNRLIMYGGSTFGDFFADFDTFGDLWEFDPRKRQWKELTAENDGPVARSGASAWLHKKKLFVFGGLASSFTVRNDLWVFDFRTSRWTELIPDGVSGSPPARHTALSGKPTRRKALLYGGRNDPSLPDDNFDDTWQLDLKTATWTNLTPEDSGGNVDPKRYAAASGIIRGDLYLQGGEIPGGQECAAMFTQNPTDELWKFDSSRGEWLLIPDERVRGEDLPRLKRAGSVAIGNSLYIFGGWDFECLENGTSGTQTWNFDVFKLQV